MFHWSHLLPKPLKKRIKSRLVKLARRIDAVNPNARRAYSQEGEDLVVFRLLALDQHPRNGFYVDVGAHHPFRYSNTQYFYELGWRGINIDPSPGVMPEFERARPHDINLEIAIAETEAELTFYEFNAPELNGFNKELAEARANVPGCTIVNQRLIAARRLKTVLDQHLPEGMQIDFMSVDVEGLDLEVVRSNDWEKYRPLLVLVEDSSVGSLREACDTKITRFMDEQGYEIISKTALTLVYADRTKIVRGLFGTHVGTFRA